MKRPNKSNDIENSHFNQLDFSINNMMFTFSEFKLANSPMFIFSEFKLAESFKDKEKYKILKIRFHEVVSKTKEEVCVWRRFSGLFRFFLMSCLRG